jgi:hypothetical protein
VVPPVLGKLFSALECIEVAGQAFVREDTGTLCKGPAYQAFKVSVLLSLADLRTLYSVRVCSP